MPKKAPTSQKAPTNPTPKKRSGKRSAGTPDWAPRFLEALAESANVRASCRVAGINRSTAYERRASDSKFAAAWVEAEQEACDVLEAVAWARATSGNTEDRHSATLLIFLLKAHRPERYRETLRQEHTSPPEAPVKVDLTVEKSPEQFDHDAFAQLFLKAASPAESRSEDPASDGSPRSDDPC